MLFSLGNSTGSCGCSQQFWVATASCEITSRRIAYFLAYGGDDYQGKYQAWEQKSSIRRFYINSSLKRRGVFSFWLSTRQLALACLHLCVHYRNSL